MMGDPVRRISALLVTTFLLSATGSTGLLLATAPQASAGPAYTQGAATVDSVSGGPWNTSQGDLGAGSAYQRSDLFPTYTPGGNTTVLGGLTEPNLAVYPNAEAAKVPYPSGVAGTPGPLDGYCSSLGANPETGSPISQPAGSLPFSPYYFPDVVRNPDGSLTGYFDYRPKDAEEAITVARSTDNGNSWTTEGEALGENHGYCPTADTNDDGQGHPYVASIGGTTSLYTLQRPTGDYEGIGLLVHGVEPAGENPLSAVPSSEQVGVDPNTFATSAVTVPTSGGEKISVSTLGSEGSPERIVAPASYEDYNAASPSKSIITCTGTSTSPVALTGCTVAGGSALAVSGNDDLVQVIATANPEGEKPSAKTYTIPAGPNKPGGEGGLATFRFLNGNTTETPITTYVMNINAPNRVYIDGVTVYCVQSNANPTTKLEFCTTQNGSPLTVHQGDPITADPIVPPTATMTTGLLAPDGIVGTLPSYPGAPEESTVVLYTEKILNYFVVGRTNGSVNGSTYKAGAVTLPASTINYTPSVTASEPLPKPGSFSVYLGATGSSIQEVTCTGFTPATQSGAPGGSLNLTGCSGGSGSVPVEAFVGGPHAAIAPISALEKIGEGKNGKTSGPEKLFGNNEDYTVLRAAYTTNGVNFTDLGAISGTTSGAGGTSGAYNDVSNPDQQDSPLSSASPTTPTTSPTSPADLTPGSTDEIELRYVGSRGTILTNPNGSYGMFLSGAWASDGDSDAFNQIFYAESTNGKEWSTPQVITSTDYTFNASREQDKALEEGKDEPLGLSAYYSGRAYGPAIVPNTNGTLTMVFSGYRLPKPITAAGTKLGTESGKQYTVSEKDPAIYRNILTAQLLPATSTVVGSSDGGSGVVGAPVTYTATVSVNSPNTGIPTGTVSFAGKSGPIAGCASQPLSAGSPDIATCTTTHASQVGGEEIKATYSGTSADATSTSSAYAEATTEAATDTVVSASDEGTGLLAAPVTYTATVTVTSPGAGAPTGTVSFSDSYGPISGCASQPLSAGAPYTATCATQHEHPGADEITATYTGDANYTGSSESSSEYVEEAPAITSASSTTFTEGSAGSFTPTATGTPAPTITETGTLPSGLEFIDGALSGTPTEAGEFPIAFTASNGVGSNAVQSFTLTVDAAPVIASASSTTFTEGSAGSFTVTAAGFPAVSISESGSLPHGVTFEPFSGALSGVPTEEGTFPIAFTASNGVGSDAVQHFTLTVDAPPVITSATEATLDDHTASSFTVIAAGTPAPTITKWGNLPEGVTFSDGLLSGTPTQTGTFQITFTAANGVGVNSTQQFTLTVVGLHVTNASPPEVKPGVAYSQQLAAIGGVTPYKWKVPAGTLPKGLRLSVAGLLWGKVSLKNYPHGGSFPITVTVTDSTKKVHQTATANFTVVIS
jgi:Bacterial Ig-like domain (group 3)/Putative Ig domain